MPDTSAQEQGFKQLFDEVKALAAEAATLKRVARQFAQPAGYESLKKVESALAKIDALEALPQALIGRARAVAAPVRSWLEVEWSRRAKDFISELSDYLREREVPVSGDGPRLSTPPFELHVDGARDRVDLYYAGELLKARLPMLPARVLREREAAYARLKRAQTEPDDLADLIIDHLGGQHGARASLPEIHFALFIRRQTAQARAALTKAKIKDYPRAQFAWDLAGLISTPSCLTRRGQTLHLVEATPTAAKSTSTSVKVVVAGETRSYSRVELRAE